MKFRQCLLSLALTTTPVAFAAWAPSRSSVAPRSSTTFSSSVQHQQSSVTALHMAANNATSDSLKVKKDVDPTAFAADLDEQLEELKNVNVPKEDPMDAYTKALHGITSEPQVEEDTTAKTTSELPKAKGFGTPTTNSNAAKKKAFLEKNKQQQAADQMATAASKALKDLDKLKEETKANKPKSVFNPVAQPYIKKEPLDVAPKKESVASAKATAKAKPVEKKEMPKKDMPKPKATIVPPAPKAEEKKSYFPTSKPEEKPKKVEQPKATTIVPPAPKAEEKKAPKAEEKKSYFPTDVKPKATIVPPKTEKKTDEKKSYFPPTPIAKKPEVKTPKEEPVVAKKTYFPPTPVAKKPAQVQKETTPIVGKTTNPFGAKPLKKKPAKKEPVQAKKAEVKVQKPTKKQDPISKVGTSVPVETGVAADKIQDKVRFETTAATTHSTKKQKLEMPKVELPKMEIPKMELPKVALPKMELPKMELPNMELPNVDQAMEMAQKTGGALLDAAKTVSKDGADWAITVKNSLNTTRVEDLDMTYEEAFHKVGKGGQGFVKICSILGGALKDTALFFADEFQNNKPKLDAVVKSKPAVKETVIAKDVSSKPLAKETPKAAATSSYLDQLESMAGKTMGDFMKQDEAAKAKRGINVRDIRIPTIPIFEKPVAAEETVVEDIQSKAGSIFGTFMSSASSLVDTVKSKAQAQTEKLQAKADELQKKHTGKDTTPKMSKTQPVRGEEKKGPFFFLDNRDD